MTPDAPHPHLSLLHIYRCCNHMDAVAAIRKLRIVYTYIYTHADSVTGENVEEDEEKKRVANGKALLLPFVGRPSSSTNKTGVHKNRLFLNLPPPQIFGCPFFYFVCFFPTKGCRLGKTKLTRGNLSSGTRLAKTKILQDNWKKIKDDVQIWLPIMMDPPPQSIAIAFPGRQWRWAFQRPSIC